MKKYNISVIPAKAGIQCEHCGGLRAFWIPAFAGMTLIRWVRAIMNQAIRCPFTSWEKSMRSFSSTFTLATVVAVIASIPVAAAFAQAPDLENMDVVLRSVPDGPVARVNGVEIPKSEFISLYESELGAVMVRLHKSEIPDGARLEVGIKCMLALVQREILLQEAEKRKLTVSRTELEKRWAEEMENLKSSVRHPKGKEIEEEELLDAVGMTRESALADLKKVLLVEKIRERIAKEGGVAVSKQEVTEFFNENKKAFKKPERLHLQQIFVKAPRRGDKENAKKRMDAHERIEKAIKRIRAGESFEAVAKSVSESPDKDNGGDLGPLPVSALPPFYVKPAATMNPGEISDIIESDSGFHLFKVIDILSGADPNLDDVAPYIRKRLEATKAKDVVNDYCQPFLKQPGFVEVYLQLDKTLTEDSGLKDKETKTTTESK